MGHAKHQESFFSQETDFTCGPAALRMVASSLGKHIDEQTLARVLKTTKEEGTSNRSFAGAAQQLGLRFQEQVDAGIDALEERVRSGWHVIACLVYPDWGTGHYAIVQRMDDETVELKDPWYGAGHVMTREDFTHAWNTPNRFDKERAWFFAVEPEGRGI